MSSSDWTTAIDDDYLFIGRKRELKNLLDNIYGVVFLIGGRRMGKTSLLYAVKRGLLSSCKSQLVPFPVYISFRTKKALDTEEQFLFSLIRGLRDEMFQSELWTTPELETIENILPSDKEIQREPFQEALLDVISTTLQKHYDGIVYLIDDVGFFIGKPWWDEAANYIRAVKDNPNIGLRSRLGFIFSGFRELKEFYQKVGSKLSEIAVVEPVKCFRQDEVKEACRERCGEMDEDTIAEVLEYGGCHPFLTQYLLIHWHEEHRCKGTPSVDQIASQFCGKRPSDFQIWWNEKDEESGLSEHEHQIYRFLLSRKDFINIEGENLSRHFSYYSLNEIGESLTYLSYAGLLTEVEEGIHRMGAKMFQDWVRKIRNHDYDVFISYSHKDSQWVRNWLLPRLEKTDLRVCIDYRDFEIGAPSLVNMERAVELSRKTLLILTPNWIQSEWTNFEALMIQTEDPIGLKRRLLPLMLEKCDLPRRLSIFTYADFRCSENREAELSRLLGQIGDEGQANAQEIEEPKTGQDEMITEKRQTSHPSSSTRALPNKTELRRKMLSAFDEERLAILCADIQERLKAANVQPPTPVSLDIVGGKGLETKILNLINRLDQRGLLQYLLDAVREAQPGLV